MNKREYDFTGVDEMIKSTFPERLRGVRNKAKLSQAQFADMLGISVAALSYYERGERIPDIVFLYKVQECFCIPDGYLLGNTSSLTKEYVNISNELALSDEAINKIKEYVDESDYYDLDNNTNNILNRLLESDELYSVINLIAWSGFESRIMYPDENYIDYIATTKLLKLISSIRNDLQCNAKINPVSDNQIIQKDYAEWLLEKYKEENFNSELNEKYRELEEKRKKYSESLQKEYIATNRYKALCNLKEAPDNGKHNPKEE